MKDPYLTCPYCGGPCKPKQIVGPQHEPDGYICLAKPCPGLYAHDTDGAIYAQRLAIARERK